VQPGIATLFSLTWQVLRADDVAGATTGLPARVAGDHRRGCIGGADDFWMFEELHFSGRRQRRDRDV
jgi:hypothetical protein